MMWCSFEVEESDASWARQIPTGGIIPRSGEVYIRDGKSYTVRDVVWRDEREGEVIGLRPTVILRELGENSDPFVEYGTSVEA